MNAYLKNADKIEFVVTYACTGRCKHCSEGNHDTSAERIDPERAYMVVKRLCAELDIKTVMAFGGEPLLYPEAVYGIIGAAKEMKVPKRQVITNGFFTKTREKMLEVARELSRCGVNDLLLSVDAFHQETIPLGVVKEFAECALAFGIPIRLQPAWLVSFDDCNPYNLRTREILESFAGLGIVPGEGNVIFPEGNARVYLREYFDGKTVENPYTEDPCNVKCLSFEPNGDVLGENFYTKDIMDIIRDYEP